MPNYIVETRKLNKTFIHKTLITRHIENIYAVKDVDLLIPKDSFYGIVGETGSGKTTLGMLIMRLIEPDSGSVLFDGVDILQLSRKELRRIRPKIQMIFQNPQSALNPVQRVKDIIGNPICFQTKLDRKKVKEEVFRLLDVVRLTPDIAECFPHQLSGGQIQRVDIARALGLKPKMLVADEPVSSLDASIRGQILNLLLQLKKDHNLTVLFIGHDLHIIRKMCDKLSVMYRGEIIESGTVEQIFSNPQMEYTRELVSMRYISSG